LAGTQSDQIKVLQQTVADYEQQGNNWKALEKLLREEIQRLERMQRRETHNLEYLKNIVLQFVHASAHRRKVLIFSFKRTEKLLKAQNSNSFPYYRPS